MTTPDNLYHYRAFGLTITSDMAVRVFAEDQEGDAVVAIRRGNVQEKLNGRIFTTQFRNWQASPNLFLLQVEGIAQYLVCDGSEIWIEPASGSTEDDIAAFLVGSTMAALLQQRRLLTIHASAINTSEGAVLFMGKSGVGKSTTLAAMLLRGFDMLTDDVSAITVDPSGAPWIVPGYPTTRLWADALTPKDKSSSGCHQLRPDLDKYLVPVERFCPSPQPVHKIFLLEIQPAPEISVTRLAYSEATQALTEFTFRHNFYRGLGLQSLHFNAVATLAKSTECFRVSRPEVPVMLGDLVSLIHQEMM